MAPSNPLQMNKNGGLYCRGRKHPPEKKLQILQKYHELKNDADGDVSCGQLAKAAMISPAYAAKIIRDIKAGNLLIHSKDAKKKVPKYGARALSTADETFLLSLRESNPETSLACYQSSLLNATGTNVSRATLSRWFATRFPRPR